MNSAAEKEKQKDIDADPLQCTEMQIQVLLERVRRLSSKVGEHQHSERLTIEHNKKLLRKYGKIKSQNVKLCKMASLYHAQATEAKEQVVSLQQTVVEMDIEREKLLTSIRMNDTIGAVHTMPPESPKIEPDIVAHPNKDDTSSRLEDNHKIVEFYNCEFDSTRHSSKIHQHIIPFSGVGSSHSDFLDYSKEKSENMPDHHTKSLKLERSLELQRDAFLRQLAVLRNEVRHAQLQRDEMKQEFDGIEKQAREQKVEMKQLKEAYGELVEAQKVLQHASALHMQQHRNQHQHNPNHKATPHPSSAPLYPHPKPPSDGRPKSLHGKRNRHKAVLSDDGVTNNLGYINFDPEKGVERVENDSTIDDEVDRVYNTTTFITSASRS